MVDQKKKTYTTIINCAKLIIILGIGVFIFLKLHDENNLNEVFVKTLYRALYQHWVLFFVVVLLMPLNWLLEARKWMILCQPVKKISTKQALISVLAGLSMGFITPHAIGDYIGRILILKGEDRGKLVGGVLLGRLFQLSATLLFGSFGVYYLFGDRIFWVYIFLLSSLFVPALLILNFDLPKINRLNKVWFYIDIIKVYSKPTLWATFLISNLRYLVFSLQFVLVLSMFTDIPLMMKATGTTWIFFAKSVIPTFNFLSDLGVREFSAIYFFEQFNVPLVPVLSASLLVWLINILVPTLVGAPLLWKIRLKA